MPKLITTEAAAQILGLSIPGASYALRTAKVKEIRIGRSIRYEQETVEALAAERVEQADIIGTADVAKMLTVAGGAVINMVKRGEIPAERAGRLYVFRRSDIDAFIARGGASITAPLPGLGPVDEDEVIPEDQPETNDDIQAYDIEVEKLPEYQTKDLWEAAILSADGNPCIGIERNPHSGHFYWVFNEKPGMRELLANHYHRQLSMCTHTLRDHYLTLKQKLKTLASS